MKKVEQKVVEEESVEPTPFGLTNKEMALIIIIRRMGEGTIDRIGVKGGEPDVIALSVTQRVDFNNEAQLQHMFKSALIPHD